MEDRKQNQTKETPEKPHADLSEKTEQNNKLSKKQQPLKIYLSVTISQYSLTIAVV